MFLLINKMENKNIIELIFFRFHLKIFPEFSVNDSLTMHPKIRLLKGCRNSLTTQSSENVITIRLFNKSDIILTQFYCTTNDFPGLMRPRPRPIILFNSNRNFIKSLLYLAVGIIT